MADPEPPFCFATVLHYSFGTQYPKAEKATYTYGYSDFPFKAK
jgi:hypothetical protein